jgi:hypothetical protein
VDKAEPTLTEETTMAKGENKMRRVQAASLSPKLSTRYTNVRNKYESYWTEAKDLRKGAQEEWDQQYPAGVDGKRYVFTVTSATLYYEEKNFERRRGKEKQPFDPAKGVNVFAHPQQGSPVRKTG